MCVFIVRSLLVILVIPSIILCSEKRNILEIANSLNTTAFIGFVREAGLQAVFEKVGENLTLFAPDNFAFNSMPEYAKGELQTNSTLLKWLMLYHLGDGIHDSKSLKNNDLLSSFCNSVKIRVNIVTTGEKRILANGGTMLKTDNLASNGIVHVISRVMYPIPWNDMMGTIASLTDLRKFYEAVKIADLKSILANSTLTVFAPNNEAFNKIPDKKWEELINDQEELRKVLMRHMVPSVEYSFGMAISNRFKMLSRDLIIIYFNSNWDVMTAYWKGVYALVTEKDISAKNGVIHTVDTVLLL